MNGYEIHLGKSIGPALANPLAILDDSRSEGAVSADQQALGTYCHGLFKHPQALSALLAWAGACEIERVDLAVRRESKLDRLADAVEQSLDWPKLEAILIGT